MKSHSRLTPYLLLAPAVIWVLVFSIWPFLNTVVLAFTDARPLKPAKFIGLTNFVTLFSDERFGYALTTSLVYVLVCVPLLTFLRYWLRRRFPEFLFSGRAITSRSSPRSWWSVSSGPGCLTRRVLLTNRFNSLV